MTARAERGSDSGVARAKPALMGRHCGCGLDIFPGREDAADDDKLRLSLGRRNHVDICCKRLSVHGALPIHSTFGDPRCNNAVMCQTGDERLGAPCPEGRAHVEAFSAQASATLAGHVGFYGSSINEDDLLGLSGNGRPPPAEPGMSGTSHMGFSTFVRDGALFCP